MTVNPNVNDNIWSRKQTKKSCPKSFHRKKFSTRFSNFINYILFTIFVPFDASAHIRLQFSYGSNKVSVYKHF